MGNPYRVDLADTDSGVVLESRALTFTEPGNQPGGSTPGAAIVRGPFSFAFNTANLAAGVAVYTPTVGDVLLDAWFEIDTAFDGTTPKADISQFTGAGGNSGLFGEFAAPVWLSAADSIDGGGGPLTGAGNGQTYQLASGTVGGTARQAPGRFVSAAPLLLVASQEGTRNGTPIDSAAGAARLYIVTATPVAFA